MTADERSPASSGAAPAHATDAAAVTPAELTAMADGQLEPAQARELRRRIAADPRLLAAFGALQAQRAAAAEAALPTDEPSAREPGESLRERLTRGRLLTLAAVLVVTVAGVVWLGPAPAGPPPAVLDSTPVLRTTAIQLGDLWPTLAAGPTDPGFMTEQNRMQNCWAFETPVVLGARPVIVDDRYGVVVATVDPDDPSGVRLTVFSRDCGFFTDGIIAQVRVPRS